MPTASNLPMPMSGAQGIAGGFDMGNRLMQQIIQRQQYAQDMELKKQQEERMREQFNKSFGLQSAAASRAAQLFPLQLQQLRQKIEAERMANDPQAQLDYIRRLQSGMAGMMGGVQGESEQAPAALTGGYTIPESGEPYTTTPQVQQQQAGGGLPPEFMQRFLGAQYKKRFGFDPFAAAPETPEQKMQREREMFLWKEGIKGQQDLSAPTKTFIAETQRSNAAIAKMLPELKALKDGYIYGITSFGRSNKADYETRAMGLVDSLMAAFKWPQQKESLEMAKQMLLRQPMETVNAYRLRLSGLIKNLEDRLKFGVESLGQNKALPNIEQSPTTQKELTYDIATGTFK